jgi:hypothetical protein
MSWFNIYSTLFWWNRSLNTNLGILLVRSSGFPAPSFRIPRQFPGSWTPGQWTVDSGHPANYIRYTLPQSTYIYWAPQCMSPRRNWDSPNPSPAKRVYPPPPGPKAHSPAARGVGEFQFRRLEKKLSILPTLCSVCTLPYSQSTVYLGQVTHNVYCKVV